MPIITLLTDFGDRDGFVGAMKGVILGICPDAVIVDISHDIAPQDVQEAAFVLRNTSAYFPPGTIHVAVVDPGVGSDRRPLVVETSRHLFVGPDNGLFAYIYRREPEVRVAEITNTEFMLSDVSRTFHGRDVFAPAAAHLAQGVRPEAFGPRLTDCNLGHVWEPVYFADRIEGHVLHTDRFGNLITDISEEKLLQAAAGRAFRIDIAGISLDRLSTSYADVGYGDALAIPGSAGLLEIAVRDGDAAGRMGVKRGDTVRVAFAG